MELMLPDSCPSILSNSCKYNCDFSPSLYSHEGMKVSDHFLVSLERTCHVLRSVCSSHVLFFFCPCKKQCTHTVHNVVARK